MAHTIVERTALRAQEQPRKDYPVQRAMQRALAGCATTGEEPGGGRTSSNAGDMEKVSFMAKLERESSATAQAASLVSSSAKMCDARRGEMNARLYG
eukprot:COSAG02_NODE_1013_length_15207_cov_4.700556_2_plen_97_part_00